jgi:hypothetical protein
MHILWHFLLSRRMPEESLKINHFLLLLNPYLFTVQDLKILVGFK